MNKSFLEAYSFVTRARSEWINREHLRKCTMMLHRTVQKIFGKIGLYGNTLYAPSKIWSKSQQDNCPR